MFPLSFPFSILRKHGNTNQSVFDPFCGRGTTNFAARLLGIHSIGIDSSPIATAVAQAKLCHTSPNRIILEAADILGLADAPQVPEGAFWKWAFSRDTLVDLCKLREELLWDCRSSTRRALRAVLLGALHGPLTRNEPSYFSNQSPRTYAPKPRYALSYWRSRVMRPPKVDVLGVIRKRAGHYFAASLPRARGYIRRSDTRRVHSLRGAPEFDWVITSPPYYGMRSYIPDQWLRSWFLGGSSEVEYAQRTNQLSHDSPESFADQLRRVWRLSAKCSHPGASLVCRFGGINDRRADSRQILKNSLTGSGWVLTTVKSAGDAMNGKRQAIQFKRPGLSPRAEYDFYARLE